MWIKLFKDFQSLSRIAHCNWNSGVSHAICQWSSHEALPFHPVITCVIAVCNVGLETLKQLYTLQVLSAMCTLHALCTSCLNSQVYSMHICINYTFNPCMQCLGVFRNCSHFTYSVLVVIPKRGTLPWPLTYLAEVTNELRHSPHTLTHLPIMKVEIL